MKVKAWKSSDGHLFEDVKQYQGHEIAEIIKACQQNWSAIADEIINRKDDVVNILTLKESSHPAARKANGAERKPRAMKKPTTAPVEVQIAPGMVAKMG